jgi:hypothetical protein
MKLLTKPTLEFPTFRWTEYRIERFRSSIPARPIRPRCRCCAPRWRSPCRCQSSRASERKRPTRSFEDLGF